jgi:hypothetical protein
MINLWKIMATAWMHAQSPTKKNPRIAKKVPHESIFFIFQEWFLETIRETLL